VTAKCEYGNVECDYWTWNVIIRPLNEIMRQCDVIMLTRNVNRVQWNVITGPCNVIMGPCNLIMGLWNVNTLPWNVIRERAM